MTLTRRTPAASYGSHDFLTLLSAREAALGLAETAPVGDVGDVRQPDPEPVPQEAPAHEPDDRDTRWNVRITSPLGWYGQYTLESWRADKRTVYVCGQPAQHTAYWRLDGRMERGQGFICTHCWTLEANRYGIDR